jgi:crotonobetainyl-CoA:carnitine CoA-transferase CaiB-like acyl-CoA transferase
MALWKISDVWMESSAPGTLERNGITNELALAVNPHVVIVRVSTYGQYGKQEYLVRPGYDAIAQAYGGLMNLTGDPAGPPQRAKYWRLHHRAHRLGGDNDGTLGGEEDRARPSDRPRTI